MTRHNSEAAGTKLEYDHNGKILSKTPCAREHGSTVTLHNLFATLPVRHKEFLRNLKKEYIKLLQVLHAYCVISCGVRISCSNQLEKGRRNLVVATNGSLNIKDNITCVFGPKQIQSLLPIQQVEPSEDDCEAYGLDQQEVRKKSDIFQISGYVSKADHGMGRSSADRQFFFINKRPCDFMKVSRVVNEVYHMYNRHQYPFVVLDISLARDSVDVNVTPDKRQVFIQEEKLLLSAIKTSLKKMLEPSGSAFDVNQGLKSQTKLASSISVLRQRHQQDENCKTKDVAARADKRNLERSGSEKGIFPSLANFKRKFGMSSIGCDIKSNEPRAKQAKLTAMFSSSAEDETDSVIDQTNESCGSVLDLTNGSAAEIEEESGTWQVRSSYTVEDNKLENVAYETASSEIKIKSNGKVMKSIDCDEEIIPLEASNIITDAPTPTKQLTSLVKDADESEHVGSEVLIVSDTADLDLSDSPTKSLRKSKARNCKMKTNRLENKNVKKHTYSFAEIVTARKSVKIDFDLKEVQRLCKSNSLQRQTHAAKARLFRAKIAPESSQNAEEELRKHVSKEMFSKMEILGQFNLGFIITKSGDDLFLIDQHASDEKYNFEDQQRNSNLKSQKLILPQHLELTAVNESILADNIEVFRKNGFEFEIDETAPPTKRVKLTSLPMSKNWTFGVEDIEELVFMLSDSPGTMCRPSRVRKMFASRACRMSVMVGTALDHAQMKRIVGHMGLMDQPWNCPHGRPTMRHLINFGMILSPE